jgi:hypothetical protein
MASRRHRTDVLVVGAGPVGLALAGELARYGVDVTVVGVAARPAPHVRQAGPRSGVEAREAAPEHPGRPVRLPCRVDAVRPYAERVEALLTDLRDGAMTLVTAGYLVVCDGAAAPLRPGPVGDTVGSAHPDPAADRVFRCGDVRPLPPGLDAEVGVGDAVNLGWKLAAALRGWAGAGLLDSYLEERRPVTTGGHLGDRYRSPIVADEEVSSTPDPFDEALPGMPAPPVPLAAGVTARDVVRHGFALLRLSTAWSPRTDVPYPPGVPALRAAFAAAGVPFTVHDCRDAEAARRYRRPFVLLRPDGYVAWRGWRPPAEPVDLVDLVRGATRRPAPVMARVPVGV